MRGERTAIIRHFERADETTDAGRAAQLATRAAINERSGGIDGLELAVELGVMAARTYGYAARGAKGVERKKLYRRAEAEARKAAASLDRLADRYAQTGDRT